MKKWKRLVAIVAVMTLVLANVSSVFAWRGGNSDNNKFDGTYNHFAIGVDVQTKDKDGNILSTSDSGYELAEKPQVYLVETVEKEVETDEVDHMEDILGECTYEFCGVPVLGWFHDCDDYREVIGQKPVYKTAIIETEELTEIELGKKQNSQKNGYEYQSSKGGFTTDSVFKVVAKLTNGTETIDVTFTITDIDNYNGTSYSFYEYCRINFCDAKEGLDIKLTYEEIVENFLDVKYDVDGDCEVIVDNGDYKAGDTVTISSEVPTKDGYEFKGWTYGDETYQPGDIVTMPEGNVTFVAEFVPVYDVTYDLNGGSSDVAIEDTNAYEENETIVVTDKVPTKEGYRFDGWTLEGNDVTEPTVTMGTENVEFVAKWVKLYTVTYVVDGNVVDTKTVDEGTDVSDWASKIYTVDESKTISDWALATENANVDSLDKDLVITATTADKTFTVIYILNGSQYGETQTVAYGDELVLEDYEAEAGYNFQGWEIKNDAADYESGIKADIVITGSTSIKNFTVIYKVDGEIVDTYENVAYGTKTPASTYVVSEGSDLSDWTVDGNAVPAAVLDNLVIEATTTQKTFTVTFVDADGDVLVEETVAYGDGVEKPANPSKEDNKYTDENGAAKWFKYSFKKWVASGEYDLSDITTVKEDMTFTATYTEREVVVKYYVLNAGLAQPSELKSYPSANYSEGLVGTIAAFEQIANDDEAVAANLVSIPTGFKSVDSDVEIKWYVIKKVNDYEWHVDGIIENQMYNLTINYVDANTQEKVAESVNATVAATDSYKYESPIMDSHKLADDAKAVIEGTMPYGDVVVTVEYDRVEVTVTYFVDGNQYGETVTYFYGDSVEALEVYEAAEGYEFSGWDKTLDELENLTEDVEINGTTSVKTYKVTYYVDGEYFAEDVVEYGATVDVNEVEYTPAEGYTFSGWTTVEGNVEKVTANVDVYGTTAEIPTEEETTEEETTTEEVTTEETTTEETTTEEITTEETTTEEEEDIEIDIPFAPPVEEPSSEEITTEEPETITTEVPLSPVDPTEEETTTEEEEDVVVDIPFADGQPQTGDSSNTAMYVMLLLTAAAGAMVFAYTKKSKTNE